MKWFYFLVAVFLDILGTTFLKASDGNEKWELSMLAFVAYTSCFWVFGKAMKEFEVGIIYAMWSGIGIVVTTSVGIWLFKEDFNVGKILFTALILVGIIGLHSVK